MGHHTSLFAVLGALAALIAVLAALRAIWRWLRVRRFRKKVLRLKRRMAKRGPDLPRIMQRLSVLETEMARAFATGKIAKDDYDALTELAKI